MLSDHTDSLVTRSVGSALASLESEVCSVIDVNPSTGACSRSPTETADACVSAAARSVLPYALFYLFIYMFIYLLFIYLLSISYAQSRIIMMVVMMIIFIVVRIKCNKSKIKL